MAVHNFIKLSDPPKTLDAALNNYLLQLYSAVQIMKGTKNKLDQMVTRRDLLAWGIITEDQASA